MIDLLKKSVYATVGLAVMTHERVEEIARGLVADAKMTEAEGKKFIDELVKKSEEGRDALQKLVNDTVESILKKMNLITRKEFNDLELRVRKLETEKPPQDVK